MAPFSVVAVAGRGKGQRLAARRLDGLVADDLVDAHFVASIMALRICSLKLARHPPQESRHSWAIAHFRGAFEAPSDLRRVAPAPADPTWLLPLSDRTPGDAVQI